VSQSQRGPSADVQHDLAAAALEPVSLVVRDGETLKCGTIGHVVAGPHQRACLPAEDLDQRLSVSCANCRDERADGLVQGVEALLHGRGKRGRLKS
jgi:hypothetical protein